MSVDTKFMPLQKVVLTSGSINPYSAGSIGFISWIDINTCVTHQIVFIKFGKKGKNRLAYGNIITNQFESTYTKGAKLADIDPIVSNKDIMRLPTEEFLGYITAFSIYLNRLQTRNYQYSTGAISKDYINAFIANPDELPVTKLCHLLIKMGMLDDWYAEALRIFNNNKRKAAVMLRLYYELATMSPNIKHYKAQLMQNYEAIFAKKAGPEIQMDDPYTRREGDDPFAKHADRKGFATIVIKNPHDNSVIERLYLNGKCIGARNRDDVTTVGLQLPNEPVAEVPTEQPIDNPWELVTYDSSN